MTAAARQRYALFDAHRPAGQASELLPRTPDDVAAIQALFALNYSEFVGPGLSASAFSRQKPALPTLTLGIAERLYVDESTSSASPSYKAIVYRCSFRPVAIRTIAPAKQ